MFLKNLFNNLKRKKHLLVSLLIGFVYLKKKNKKEKLFCYGLTKIVKDKTPCAYKQSFTSDQQSQEEEVSLLIAFVYLKKKTKKKKLFCYGLIKIVKDKTPCIYKQPFTSDQFVGLAAFYVNKLLLSIFFFKKNHREGFGFITF